MSRLSRALGGLLRAGTCPEPACGANVLVSPKTGLIRRHSPRGELAGHGWCPAGGTVHPDWREGEWT